LRPVTVWIEPTESNAEALFAGLEEFGAPTTGIVPRDFTEPHVFFQIGVEPVRIDIMTSVPGLAFEAAWKNRVIVDFGGESAPVLCREDVLKSKIAAGRRRDHRDVKKMAQRKPQLPKVRRRK
jgi:hypothetical protein